MANLWKYLKDPYKLFLRELCKHPQWFSDEQYVKLKYRFRTGKKLNLTNPLTFNEKLQWLKLYDHNPLYTRMVDKIQVKDYVGKIIGYGYIVPTIATWDTVDEIEWDKLPNSFVIKCNHDSGGIVICKDKSKFDISQAIKKLKYSMAHDNYTVTREWPYKDVKRRLICEEYLEDNETGELRDYKFLCFNGEAKAMFIASDRGKNEETKIDYFDMGFNHLPIQRTHPNSPKMLSKPICFEEMRKLANQLSQNIPHVRVDFYQVNGKVYFGELTFFTGGGFGPFMPDSWDRVFGDFLALPSRKINK